MAGQTVVLRIVARIIAVVLTVVLAVPCRSFGSTKITSLAVTAIHDGKNDSVSDELTESLSKTLKQSRLLHVVDVPLVNDVTSYKSSSPESVQKNVLNEDVEIKAAGEAFRRANEDFFKFKNKSAAANARRAASALESSSLDVSKKGRLMVDVYLTQAMIYQAISNKNEVRAALTRVLKLDPTYVLDEKAYPPSIRKIFDEILSSNAGERSSVIRVDSKPRAVDVFLNGVQKGVTPLDINNLPAGQYQITLSANNYNPVQRVVDLHVGKKVTVKETMKWGRDSGTNIEENDRAAIVANGVQLGKSLKVDKIIFVDVDEKGSGAGEISAQMVDVRYKAALRPVVIKYDSKRKGVEASLSEMVSRLLEDAAVDIAKDPSSSVDPLGVNDPLLLGENTKQRKISTRNLLLIIGGAALAAGGATAAALLLGGGGDKGSLHVQFKFK